VHHGAELELDPLRHTEPMKLVAHDSLKLVIGVLENFEKHVGWKNVRLSTEIAVYLVKGTT